MVFLASVGPFHLILKPVFFPPFQSYGSYGQQQGGGQSKAGQQSQQVNFSIVNSFLLDPIYNSV